MTHATRLAVVIDDDPQCLDAISGYLELKGFAVSKFPDLQAVRRDAPHTKLTPDIVIVDGTFAGSLTYEDAISSYKNAVGEFPVIVLTGDTSDAAKQRAGKAGFHYVSKPVQPHILDLLIEGLLGMKRD